MPCDDIPSPKLDFSGPKEPASHPAFIFPISPTSSNINFRWPGRQDPYCALSHDGACVAWHVYYFSVSWDHLVAPSRGFNGFLCPASLVMNCSGRRFPCLSSPPDGMLYRGVLVRHPCLCFYRERERGCQCRVLVASNSVA